MGKHLKNKTKKSNFQKRQKTKHNITVQRIPVSNEKQARFSKYQIMTRVGTICAIVFFILLGLCIEIFL